MDSQPLYIQIGAILGILSSIILLILEFTRFYKTIQSFYRFVFRIIKLMWDKIRCWYWWKKCQPTWRIVDVGQVAITKIEKGYIQFGIKMSATISYHNPDDRYTLYISRCPFVLLYHNGRGKSAEPFRLSTDVTGGRDIKPLSDYSITYNFHENIWAKPDINNITSCRFKEEGDASISTHSHNLSGKMKLVGTSKNRVPVVWEEK